MEFTHVLSSGSDQIDPKTRISSTKVKDKVTKKNAILRALAGTSWAMEKETFITTLKAVSKSVITYCAPIWAPTLADSNWEPLQAAQNAD